MEKEFRADLRIARTRSGLSNMDVAHLLGCSKDRVSRLENGVARLSLGEIASLYLIYGLPFETTFGLLCHDLAEHIHNRVLSVPQEPAHWAGKRMLRLNSLESLAQRLQALTNMNHER